MTEELEHSIKTKRFDALTAAEKQELAELEIDQEGFYALKSLYIKMGKKSTNMEVGSDVKQRLDHLFATTYQNKKPTLFKRLMGLLFPQEKSWLMRPIIQFASVVFLVTLGITVFNTNKSFDRNLSQYIPKKLDALKKENNSFIEEGDEVESSKENSTLNNRFESRKGEIERMNYEVIKSEVVAQRIPQKKKEELNEFEFLEESEKSTNSREWVNPDLFAQPTLQTTSTSFSVNAAPISVDYLSKGSTITKKQLNTERFEDAVVNSHPAVTQNASHNNLAVLDLLTPLF